MIVLIIAIVLVLANSWHVINAWISQPANTYFTGIAHYYTDYFLYTSLMAQKGWIFTEHLFTNESLPPTWIYWLYTIIGKLGNPFVIYNLSIIVFSTIALFLWWKIIQKTSERPVIAFLFLATASGFVDFWFSPFPAFNRLGGVPHQIFQTILLLSVIQISQMRPMSPIRLILFSFLAAIANPIQTLLLSIALVITKPKNVFYLLPAALGALLTNAEFSRNPILMAAKVWENNQNVSVSLWQFLLAVGPIAILIPFGIKPFLFVIPGSTRNPSSLQRVLFLYCSLSILTFLSPIPTLLGTSPVRWLSPAAYTTFPILAALGLTRISSQLSSDRRKVDYFVKGILLALYVVVTIPSLLNQITVRQNAPRDLLYAPNEIIRNLRNLPNNGVILANPTTRYDVLVPVFTGRKSFTGHPIHTLYPSVKEELRRKYFSGEMTEEEKQKFLTDHNITTIIP